MYIINVIANSQTLCLTNDKERSKERKRIGTNAKQNQKAANETDDKKKN